MAAGIPGVGIGGLFYVVSAAAAPVRELHRMLTRSTRAPAWSAAFRLCAMALAIIGGMWLTGLLVGSALHAMDYRAQHAGAPLAANGTASLWRVGALVLSGGTLALVLVIVQVARVALGPARAQPRDARRVQDTMLMVFLVSATVAAATPLRGQARTSATTLRARAEAAYAAGDKAETERAYAALVAAAPDDSRALFRLAALRADRPADASSLLARYVALESGDAWGWIAYADALSLSGQHRAAEDAMGHAERLAPTERDVMIAHARVLARAGRTDAAIARYTTRVTTDPADEQAWQALAEQRRRAGQLPDAIAALERAQSLHQTTRRASQIEQWKHEARVQVEPAVALTRDSDANITRRAGLNVRLPLVARTTFSVAASALEAINTELFPGTPTAQSASMGVSWRPRAAFSADATAGLTQVTAPPTQVTTTTTTTGPRQRPRTITATSLQTNAATAPTGQVRLRWRSVAGGPSLDVRATRSVLDATPELLANRVVRTEAGATADVPLLAGFRARASARSAQLTAPAERTNQRLLLGAALVRPIVHWGDIALNAQRIQVARATTQGYFAPRSADIAEVGTYIERESERGVLLAVDAGVGMQRMQAFDAAATSAWQPAARLWSHLDVPMSRALLLRAELDVYDGGVARDAATAAHWRWISATLGVRIAP